MGRNAPEPAQAVLSKAELICLTGYRRGAEQLVELHKRGFHRAYRNRAGHVVVERPHYIAVCSSSPGSATTTAVGPRWSKNVR